MNQQVRKIFAEAAALPTDDREVYLAEACGNDAELRLEVQRLLIDTERAGLFFGADNENETIAADGSGQTSGKKSSPSPCEPPFSPADTSPPPAEPITESEGDTIGSYKLIQELGEGGFGTVWMAEQSEPISRRVALKVIKAGMDTREVLARFESERQALAMMDHPHIAKVIDAGATQTGRPWFAMELVKGIPITQFCDEQELPVEERLTLFGDVCSAINHAHQKGIIHRDIKPSNVLVALAGDKPTVKVIDFGIAKATQSKLTDRTVFTRHEQLIGTPVYMSPEQASLSALDIDTRSDIYALGILIYEILAGRPPFEARSLATAGYDEMRRIIREEEPCTPSSLLSKATGEERARIAKARRIDVGKVDRLVEADLDWIVMKAIEKDRSRRYETVNAFARDIGRYLNNEPVEAAAPSFSYQFSKFARRNSAAIGVAASILVILFGATAVSSWQAVQTTRALEKVEQERDGKEAALAEAEVIADFLADMFGSVAPGEEEGGLDVKVADVLGRAVKELEVNDTIPPSRRAKLQASLAKTYASLALYQEAVPLTEEVRDYYSATLGREHADTLLAIANVASSYHAIARLEEALAMREEVLELSRKVNGPEHPDTLQAVAGLAGSYHSAGRRGEALEMREKVLEQSRKVNGLEHPSTIEAMSAMAISYGAFSKQDEVIALRVGILKLSRKVFGPEHPSTIKAMSAMALSYLAFGREEDSLEIMEEVEQLSRKVFGSEHPATLNAIARLANRYISKGGRLDDVIELREELLKVRHKRNGPEHPDTISAMASLKDVYGKAGRSEEVARIEAELLQKREKLLENYRAGRTPGTAGTLWNMHLLAGIYGEAGRLDEEVRLREDVQALCAELSGPNDAFTLKLMTKLALAYRAADRTNEAIALETEALALKREHTPNDKSGILESLQSLANCYMKSGQATKAKQLRDEASKLRRKKR